MFSSGIVILPGLSAHHFYFLVYEYGSISWKEGLSLPAYPPTRAMDDGNNYLIALNKYLTEHLAFSWCMKLKTLLRFCGDEPSHEICTGTVVDFGKMLLRASSSILPNTSL